MGQSQNFKSGESTLCFTPKNRIFYFQTHAYFNMTKSKICGVVSHKSKIMTLKESKTYLRYRQQNSGEIKVKVRENN